MDWNTVLIPTAPLKLLYSLNLVDKIVAAGSAMDAAPDSPERAWCQAFLRHGGVAHLVKVRAWGGGAIAVHEHACLCATFQLSPARPLCTSCRALRA